MAHEYDDELEVLMLHNPLGGKPKKVGSSIFLGLERKDSTVDVSEIREDTARRYHLGYCRCGCKITVGEKRALVMVKTLSKFMEIFDENELDAKVLKNVMSYPQRRS